MMQRAQTNTAKLFRTAFHRSNVTKTTATATATMSSGCISNANKNPNPKHSKQQADPKAICLLSAAALFAAGVSASAGLRFASEIAACEYTEHTDHHGRTYTYDTVKRCIVGNGQSNATISNATISNPAIPHQQRLQSNITLATKHRVAMCEWTADQCRHNGEPRTQSIRALFKHVKASGYDGVEMTLDYFQRKYFANHSKEQIAVAAKKMALEYDLQIFGANIWNVFDYPGMDWTEQVKALKEEARLTKLMGGQYLTFQIWLPEKYQGTAGEYRNDSAYLSMCAQRINDLQQACWEEGMNCYIETHVQRISEDPEAFANILRQSGTATETNGDVSHYIYRNFKNNTKAMKEILGRMGHTHQRMCRTYGDLSANVEDPQQDWENYGMTWSAFNFTKPGLKGGLSSRVICGESGPMHAVSDPLSNDARLVPLYRMMARYADASAAGVELDIHPKVYNPFVVHE